MAPQDVLDFWFGAPGSPGYGGKRGVWFRKSDGFDNAVRERFLPLYELAAGGGLAGWKDSPHSLLALIIVLDQFPRNMFRNDACAFATDAPALATAQRLVACGWDLELAPLERWFAYMPYVHAEDIEQQQRSVELFERLAADAALDEPVAWARKHYEVIARFGRFPHRNAVLKRLSTCEELEFLKQPGSIF